MENSQKIFYYKKITCIISTISLMLFALLIYSTPMIKLGDSNELVTIVDFIQRLIKDESSILYNLNKLSETLFKTNLNINMFLIVLFISVMSIVVLLSAIIYLIVFFILSQIINLMYCINLSYEDYIEYLNSPEKLDYKEKRKIQRFMNSSKHFITLYVVALFIYSFIINVESVFNFGENILRYCTPSPTGIIIFVIFGLYILLDIAIKTYLDYSENKYKNSVKKASSKVLILLLCIIALIISSTHLFISSEMGVSEKYSMLYYINEILSLNVSIPTEAVSEYSSFFTKCGIGLLLYYIYLITLISATITLIISFNKKKKGNNLGFSIFLLIVGICFSSVFKNILSHELFGGLIKLTGSVTLMIILPIVMIVIDVLDIVVDKKNIMGFGTVNTPKQNSLNGEASQPNPGFKNQQMNQNNYNPNNQYNNQNNIEINDYNKRVMNEVHNEYQRQTNGIPIYTKENSFDDSINNQFNQNNDYNTQKADEQFNNENINNNVQMNNDISNSNNSNNKSDYEEIKQVINNGLSEEHNSDIDK